MSYERMLAVGTIPAFARFYYTNEQLFASVSSETNMRASVIFDKDGESQEEKYAISQDESVKVTRLIREAVNDVFIKILRVLEDVDNSVFINSPIMLSDGLGVSSAIDTAGATETAIIPASSTLNKIWKMTAGASPYVAGDYIICTNATGPVFALKSARVAPTSAILGATLYVVAAFGDFAIGDTIVCITASTTAPVFAKANITASGGAFKDNTGYKTRILSAIDVKIEQCIHYHMMKGWYVSMALEKDATINMAEYQRYINELLGLLRPLRSRLAL